jgi:hypothetical protein
MKRRGVPALIVLAFLLAAAMGWTENYSSILTEASFGLFWNAMDAASSVNGAGKQPVFSTLGKPYFFGGLSNFSDLPTGSEYTNVPLTLGYYSGGSTPWAVFDNTFVSTTTSTLMDGITATYLTKNVAVGPDSTDYPWADTTTNTQYVYHDAWNLNDRVFFLKNLGGFNLGALLNASYVQKANPITAISTWMAANVTETYTRYYDPTSADLTVAPTPTLNYTRTRAYTSPDSEVSLRLGVPVYFGAGSIGLEIAPTVGWYSRNLSSTYTEEYTAPQQAGANFFNITTLDSVDDTWGSVDASVDATATLPAIIGSHPFNLFRINLYGSANIYYAPPAITTTRIQRYSYAGGGAPLVLTGGGLTQDDMTTDTRKGNIGYSLSPSAEHLLYTDLGPGTTLGMGPRLALSLTSSPVEYYTTQSVEVSKTELGPTFDGLYDSSTDRITTTTTTNYHNEDSGPLDLGVGAYLPMSVMFRPAGAPFGITIGGEIGIEYTARFVSDAPQTQRKETTVVDGTGAAVAYTPDVVSAPDVAAQTRMNSIWNFLAQYGLGVNVALPREASLDILLRGSSSTDWLRIQVLVPLK